MISSEEVKEVKFVQIVIGSWDQKDRTRTYSTLALGDNGRVYRHDKGAGGWIALPKRILTPKQVAQYHKKKYGSAFDPTKEIIDEEDE